MPTQCLAIGPGRCQGLDLGLGCAPIGPGFALPVQCLTAQVGHLLEGRTGRLILDVGVAVHEHPEPKP